MNVIPSTFRSVLIVAIGAVLAFGAFQFFATGESAKSYAASNPLFIPTLIDSSQADGPIKITMRDTQHAFLEGVMSETKGFDQSYLGPTIRLHKGETMQLEFVNKTAHPTTVHGHGLHVDGDVDGGPQSIIRPGEARTVALEIVQEAGTSWYHPHLMGRTAEDVHAGLAGMYIIEDENSAALPLPKAYGIDDIPLIIQDRTFVDGAMQPYLAGQNARMDGLREETLVVNGTIGAFQKAPAGWVRLRLLNGSNARFYRFFLSSDQAFFKIATEGGFLAAPVEMTEIVMAPGERNEIMIDLSSGAGANLMAEFLASDPGEAGSVAGWLAPSNPVQTVLEIRPDPSLPAQGPLPPKLNTIEFFTKADQQSATKRTFHLGMDMADDAGPISMDNQFTINGGAMDMRVLSHAAKRGALEEWTITAEMMPHPFHVHGVSFQIVSHNGQPPSAADRGWKDTIVVTDQPTVLLMRFNHAASEEYPYMFHCHILEHEDFGMMGQFTVQ